MVIGVVAKIAASYFRYMTLVSSYNGVGDASDYDTWGRQFVAFWMGNGPEPYLPDLRKTNFIRWFTGVVYYVFGSNVIAGFFVFGLLALDRLLPLVPGDRRLRAVPRQAAVPRPRAVRAEPRVLAVVDRQGIADAARPRRHGARGGHVPADSDCSPGC